MAAAPVAPPPDIVEVGPYEEQFHNVWDAVCLRGIRVYSYPFDNFLSCFTSTTRELKRPLQRYLYVIIALPFWTLCTLLTVPVGLLFLLLWLPISGLRKPYRYSYVRNTPNIAQTRPKSTYTCVTSNVCIMDEFLTRFNNQQNTYQKARDMGKTIVTQQLGMREEFTLISQKNLTESDIQRLRDEKLASIGAYDTCTSHQHKPESGDYSKRDQNSNGYNLIQNGASNITRRHQSNGFKGDSFSSEGNTGFDHRRHQSNGVKKEEEGTVRNEEEESTAFDHSVLAEFPDIDFLCLQECWELAQTKKLVKELHKVFPYIVYDPRVDSPSSNMFMLNSGTLIASRYPITDIDFDFYRCSYKHDRLASKGLLQVKVSLGTVADGRQAVGYLYNTHLQAYQDIYPVQQRQMDDIVRWTDNFRHRKHAQNDVVAFDLVAGDWNADNMSKVDEGTQDHPLFDTYMDVCRVRAGQDHGWTVGTEMRHTPLDDPLIQTPRGLQLALQDPYLLQHYVLSADIDAAVLSMAFDMPPRDQDGRLILSPVGGRRRIDFVIYRKGDGVSVVAYNPVTQLAGLTDHIPNCLTFNVTL